MKIIDRIKSYFNKSDSAPRMAKTNSFSFNQYGNGSKYPGGMSTQKIVDIHDHFAIRQNVRNAMYDSVECRALVTSIVDTVVDSGMRLKPTPIPEILGITPEKAEEWAEDVAQKFHIWASSKKSHASRINNYYQNQRLYQLFRQRDGDVFTRLYYTKEKDTVNPLQIDFLDPNQIRGDAYTSTYMQAKTDDGIIRDGKGRETAYKTWNYNGETGQYTETQIPAVGEKSGRVFMLHGFIPEYAGQGRGLSPMAHLLQELEKITDFKVATLQKAIEQASLVMAVENEKNDSSNPFEGRVAGPYSYGAPSEDNTVNTGKDTDPVINYTAMPEATHTQPGVGVFNLRAGDKLQFLKDTSPSAQFDIFCNSIFTSIASSVGWSIEVVQKKFNANYSASRATLLLCHRTAIIERNEQNSDFDNPIYEMWLSEEIAAGRVQAPGFSDPLLKMAWLCAEWSGSPMPNIDPQKSANADLLYVQMGAQTLDDVARNFNGSSGKANRAKLERQWNELPVPGLPILPVNTQPIEQSASVNNKKQPENNRGDLVTIQTPMGDVDFQMKKRSVKKTATYKDMYGQEKQLEIFEKEI